MRCGRGHEIVCFTETPSGTVIHDQPVFPKHDSITGFADGKFGEWIGIDPIKKFGGTGPLHRDLGLRDFLAGGQIRLPVSNLAKLKTFLQMFSIAILLTGETGNKIINFQDYNAQTIGIILLWLSAFLTLYTGYEYLRKGIDHAISEDEKS